MKLLRLLACIVLGHPLGAWNEWPDGWHWRECACRRIYENQGPVYRTERAWRDR